MSDNKKAALGKGLDALLSIDQDFDIIGNRPVGGDSSGSDIKNNGIVLIPLEQLSPNPEQPRTFFDEDALRELSASIKQQGVIQPILVERKDNSNQYQIIAGERRFRAAQLAELVEIPAIIREFTREEKLEIALIENIQRENLSPLEEAKAYKNLMDELQITQQDVADRVGKNRSTVANSLRLLKLPEDLQQAINNQTLSAGHARAILSLNNPAEQQMLARIIMDKGLSVREAESLASRWNLGDHESLAGERNIQKISYKDPDLVQVEEMLIEKLGTKVQIKGSGRKGKIEIAYYSSDDLQRVLDLFTR